MCITSPSKSKCSCKECFRGIDSSQKVGLHIRHYFFKGFMFMCIDVSPAFMPVYYMPTLPRRSEGGVKSPGTRVRDGCEPSLCVWMRSIKRGSPLRTSSALNC